MFLSGHAFNLPVMRFRIFISSVQKEFAEERRMLLIEMSLQQSIQFLRA